MKDADFAQKMVDVADAAGVSLASRDWHLSDHGY